MAPITIRDPKLGAEREALANRLLVRPQIEARNIVNGRLGLCVPDRWIPTPSESSEYTGCLVLRRGSDNTHANPTGVSDSAVQDALSEIPHVDSAMVTRGSTGVGAWKVLLFMRFPEVRV